VYRTPRVFDRRAWLAPRCWRAGVVCLRHRRASGGRDSVRPRRRSTPRRLTSLVSAFPAELAPIAAATEIETTIQIAGRDFYVGRLGGVSVLLGLTGIGLVNATNRAHDLLAHGQIAASSMSGTAGTSHHIGDVVLASDLVEGDRKRVFHPNAALLALARRAATALPEPLERCTVPGKSPDAPVVCLLLITVTFGGATSAPIPSGGTPFVHAGGRRDVDASCLHDGLPGDRRDVRTEADVDVRRGGHGDRRRRARRRAASSPLSRRSRRLRRWRRPLGDRGFFAQFLDYYRLAALNAGDVTRAVIVELGGSPVTDRHAAPAGCSPRTGGAVPRSGSRRTLTAPTAG